MSHDSFQPEHSSRPHHTRAGAGGASWFWLAVAGVALALVFGLLAFGGGGGGETFVPADVGGAPSVEPTAPATGAEATGGETTGTLPAGD